MKKTSLLAAAVLAAALTGQAAIFNFTATLTGGQEATPNLSTAVGTASATYDSVTGQFSFGGTYSGLTSAATEAHIHFGDPGVAGPIVLPVTLIPPNSTSGAMAANFSPLGAPMPAQLLAEDWYVNIHNVNFPGGEIRGQLMLTPVPEPETYAAMAGVALVGFGVWRRTRR